MSITTIIDLPMPPSVNRIWRAAKAGKRRVSRSVAYRDWLLQADRLALATGALKRRPMITGRFIAQIVLPFEYIDDMGRDPPFDVDNRTKGVLDWAQGRGLIANDRRCMLMTIRWGYHWEAPTGCRLTLQEWTPSDSTHRPARPAQP